MDFGYRVWCNNKKEYEKDAVLLKKNGELCELNMGLRPLRPETHFVERCSGLKDYISDEFLYEGDIITVTAYSYNECEECVTGRLILTVLGFAIIDEDDKSHALYDLQGSYTTEYSKVGNVHYEEIA